MDKKQTHSVYYDDIKRCAYYSKGYCMLRDDTCKPSSLKCKRNKVAYKNTSLSLGITNNETVCKSTRSRNIYNPFVAERYGSNQKISEIFYDEQTTKLYVFKGFLNLSKENTTDYTMAIKDFWTGEERKVLVAYNSIRKRYYISYTQLQWLHKNKIYPAARFFECVDGTEAMEGTFFNPFSRLALYGYSVGQKGLDDEERRKILAYVIDYQIMSKSKIISHLQGLISLRDKRTDADFSCAINKWQKDIIFVNEYRKKY